MFKICKTDEGVTLSFKVRNRNEILEPVKLPDVDAAKALVRAIRKAIRAERCRFAFLCGNRGPGRLEIRDAKDKMLCKSHVYKNNYQSDKGLQCILKYGVSRKVQIISDEIW